MSAPPTGATPPQPGPLPAPSEDELVAAGPELRDRALTLPWAATALGVEPARLKALARAGELLVVPGPWPMRKEHASGLGYFVPGWQLAGGRGVHEALPTLLEAAAPRGWTSLDLHRFMIAPGDEGGASPADLLRRGEADRVALVRREPEPGQSPTTPAARRRFARPRLLHREAPA